jgi:hypothetical protein
MRIYFTHHELSYQTVFFSLWHDYFGKLPSFSSSCLLFLLLCHLPPNHPHMQDDGNDHPCKSSGSKNERHYSRKEDPPRTKRKRMLIETREAKLSFDGTFYFASPFPSTYLLLYMLQPYIR